MFSLPLTRRLASLIAIAIAVVCGSKSAHAGVITEASWGERALVTSVNLPAEAPQEGTLRDGANAGMEGLPISSTSGSQVAGLASSFTRLVNESVTGRTLIVDELLPDDPFLGGLPKPA